MLNHEVIPHFLLTCGGSCGVIEFVPRTEAVGVFVEARVGIFAVCIFHVRIPFVVGYRYRILPLPQRVKRKLLSVTTHKFVMKVLEFINRPTTVISVIGEIVYVNSVILHTDRLRIV
jgi:hypothetical protein